MQGRSSSSARSRQEYNPETTKEENLPFRLGDVVMCRYSSYPYWPAKIENKHQRRHRDTYWCFRRTVSGATVLSFWCNFFNDTAGWVRHDRMVHYHPSIVEDALLSADQEYFSLQREALKEAHHAYKKLPWKSSAPCSLPHDYGCLAVPDDPDSLESESEEAAEQPSAAAAAEDDEDNVRNAVSEKCDTANEGERRRLRAKQHPAKRVRAAISTPASAKCETHKQKTKRDSHKRQSPLPEPPAPPRPRKRTKTETEPTSTPQQTPYDRNPARPRACGGGDVKGYSEMEPAKKCVSGTENGTRAGNTLVTPPSAATHAHVKDAGSDGEPSFAELFEEFNYLKHQNAQLTRRNAELEKKTNVLIHFSSPASPDPIAVEVPGAEAYLSQRTTSREFAKTMALLNATLKQFMTMATKADRLRNGAEVVCKRLRAEYEAVCKEIVETEKEAVSIEASLINVLVTLLKMRVSLPDLRSHKAGNIVRAVGKACKELPSIAKLTSVIYDSWKDQVLQYLQKPDNGGEQAKASSARSTPRVASLREDPEVYADDDANLDADAKVGGEKVKDYKEACSEGKGGKYKGTGVKNGSCKEPISCDQSPVASRKDNDANAEANPNDYEEYDEDNLYYEKGKKGSKAGKVVVMIPKKTTSDTSDCDYNEDKEDTETAADSEEEDKDKVDGTETEVEGGRRVAENV